MTTLPTALKKTAGEGGTGFQGQVKGSVYRWIESVQNWATSTQADVVSVTALSLTNASAITSINSAIVIIDNDITSIESTITSINSTITSINTYLDDGPYRVNTALYRRYYHLPIDAFNPGATGATWVAANANHVGGYKLDAAAEILQFGVDIHSDWDGASNPIVELSFCPNVAGSAEDTVDLKLVAYYNGAGDTSTKTQTVEIATITDGTQYKVNKVEFELDRSALGNIIEAGDKIGFLLNLETDTSEIDDVVILQGSGSFYYNTTHVGIENGDT